MKLKNKRLLYGGLLAIFFGVAIFFGIYQIAPQSTDPVKVMSIAGQVAGALAGIGLALILMAFVFSPAPRKPRS